MAQARHLAGACLTGNSRAGVVSWWLAPSTAGGEVRSLTSVRAFSSDAGQYQEGPADPGAAPRIVVVGGGFGGLNTVIRLTSLFWPKGKKPEVTLVDQGDRFVFKPLLYELLNQTATPREVAPRYEELLAPYPAVRFVQSKVVAAQLAQLLPSGGSSTGGTVQLADGTSLSYDWLVLALGAQVDVRGVPGVLELAVPFNTLEDAIRVRDALEAVEQLARAQVGNRSVAVVGAGYAGVELACVLAERLRGNGLDSSQVQVHLVTPGKTILEGSPAGQREAAEQVLAGYGVSVITGTRVRGLAPSAGASSAYALPTAADVTLDDRPSPEQGLRQAATSLRHTQQAMDPASTSSSFTESAAASTAGVSQQQQQAAGGGEGGGSRGEWQLPADLVVWTAGSSPATRAARQEFPFPTSAKGSVQTDATLRVLGHARVFAMGDVSVADQGYVQDEAALQTGGASGSASSSSSLTSAHQQHQGVGFPATAQVALQQADYVSWNLWAAMMGRTLLPFRYQHLGSMMSLGAYNAAVDLPIAVPGAITSLLQASPLRPIYNTLGVKFGSSNEEGGVTLEGPLAAVLRRAAYLYRQPTNGQRFTVASEWVSQASTVAMGLLATLRQRRETYAPSSPSGWKP